VRVLAVFHLVVGAIALLFAVGIGVWATLFGVALRVAGATDGFPPLYVFYPFLPPLAVWLILSLAELATGTELLRRRPAARRWAAALATIHMVAVPILLTALSWYLAESMTPSLPAALACGAGMAVGVSELWVVFGRLTRW
jgi:hypothetical protein